MDHTVVQVRDPKGEVTFNDIYDYGIVTGQGGTAAGRMLAN
jgi:hypothetical protein